MTVEQLIAALSEMPGHHEVKVPGHYCDWECGCAGCGDAFASDVGAASGACVVIT